MPKSAASSQGIVSVLSKGHTLYRSHPRPIGEEHRQNEFMRLLNEASIDENPDVPVRLLDRNGLKIRWDKACIEHEVGRNPKRVTLIVNSEGETVGIRLIEHSEEQSVDERVKALLARPDHFFQNDIKRGTSVSKRAERPGQVRFREALRIVWNDRCAVSGCDVVEVLEAAHIRPVSKEGADHPSNGLLLRADIHLLFDANLMGFNYENGALRCHLKGQSVIGSYYDELDGKEITLPDCREMLPSHELIKQRWQAFLEEHIV